MIRKRQSTPLICRVESFKLGMILSARFGRIVSHSIHSICHVGVISD